MHRTFSAANQEKLEKKEADEAHLKKTDFIKGKSGAVASSLKSSLPPKDNSGTLHIPIGVGSLSSPRNNLVDALERTSNYHMTLERLKRVTPG